MKQRYSLLFILSLILGSFGPASNSHADQPTLHIKSFKSPKLAEPAAPKDNPAELSGNLEETSEESPTSRVWKKYKALSTGKSLEDEKKQGSTLEKPETPEKPTPPSAMQQNNAKQQTIKKKTGLAAMIDEYKERKKQRSQMRRVTITDPDKNADKN